MYKKNLFLSLLAAWMLSACGTLEVSIEQPATPPPTATSAPLLVAPTAAISTPSPEPPFSGQGSLLAYFRESNGQEQLVFLDPDSLGRKVIPLPAEIPPDTRLISPDGKYLAFYSGSVGKCDPFGNTSIGDHLVLNLLDLNTLQVQEVASLLSPDYPENFKKSAAGLFAQGAVEKNDESVVVGLKSAFLCGIRSLAWSPDGHSLAFAGGMDGPSADVYLYDPSTNKIQRLTDGLDEVQRINWSTDGASLESAGALWYGEGMTYTYYRIALNGAGAKTRACPPATQISLPDNPHVHFTYSSDNGVGLYGLRLVDADTCSSRSIWAGAFRQFEFDPGTNMIAITPWSLTLDRSPQNQNFAEGLYLIDARTGQQTRLLDGQWLIYPFGIGQRRFFVRNKNDESQAYFILENGTLLPASSDIELVSVAPDQNHWMSLGKTLKIFDTEDTLIQETSLPFTDNQNLTILWTPDSAGLFLNRDAKICALDPLDGSIQLVEADLAQSYPSNWSLKWVVEHK